MKKLLIAAFGVVFGTVSAYAACSSNEIDVNGDGTNCQTAHSALAQQMETLLNFAFRHAEHFTLIVAMVEHYPELVFRVKR